MAVGEKHSLGLQTWCSAPAFHAALGSQIPRQQSLSPQANRHAEDREFLAPAPIGGADHSLTSDSYWSELDAASQHVHEPLLPEE